MDAVAESGRSPVSKHQIQPECGKLVCWRGAGRRNLSRETKLSGANKDREEIIFPVQLTTRRIDNLTRLIHALLYVMTIRTYCYCLYCTCPLLHTLPMVDMGKNMPTLISQWDYLNMQHPLKLPWKLLTLCRLTLGGERHRYAIT